MNNLFLFYLLQIYRQIVLFLLSFNLLGFTLAKEIVGKLANLKMTHKNKGLFSVCFFSPTSIVLPCSEICFLETPPQFLSQYWRQMQHTPHYRL